MVVKPHDFIVPGKRGLVQPTLKCRGPEYLRIIYGPECSIPANLSRLQQPTVNPTVQPTPDPTQPPAPSPTQPTYSNIVGTYSGQIQNRTYSTWVTASLTITFNQNGGNLGGYCTVRSPLVGSGSLSGTISTDGKVYFTVYISADGIDLYFSDSISGGYLQGSYSVSNGQWGVWIV